MKTHAREELHEMLCDILGSRNVYFQPTNNIHMKYPAIIYSRSNVNNRYADNLAYLQNVGYKVVVIDSNPDSEIVKRVAKLPLCRFNAHYVSENLNHDAFTLFYR